MTDDAPIVRIEIVDKKLPPGRMGRVWSFVNKPLFVTVAAFLMTGLLGTIVTSALNDGEKQGARLDEEIKGRFVRWDAQETVLQAAMSDRLADSKLLAAALIGKRPADDIVQRWKQYQDSYREYEISNAPSTVALRTFAGSDVEDSMLLDDYRNNVFTLYKNRLTSRFKMLDRCLTNAYIAYSQPALSRKLSPVSILSLCDRAAQLGFAEAAGKLDDCLTTYFIELNDVMSLKHRIVSSRIRATTSARRFFSRAFEEEVQHNKDLACSNYAALHATLEKACRWIPSDPFERYWKQGLALHHCPLQGKS
jgi:hypothetical protein